MSEENKKETVYMPVLFSRRLDERLVVVDKFLPNEQAFATHNFLLLYDSLLKNKIRQKACSFLRAKSVF